MRYTTKQYAGSLLSVLGNKGVEKQKEVIRKFLRFLQKNGEAAKRRQIMVEIEREYLEKNNTRKVQVETANGADKTMIKEIKNMFGDKTLISEKVSPEILGGVKIFIDEENLIDASARTQLDRMFNRSKTTNLS